ncbi:hypothetical protein E2C01_090870 [Portunus trituberculatus]|uniref:Uncharacterized protein n=1 Tax=Portunus trituberculatus TaxID=210409 RepID=A0A5B7JFX3_PORTR|nr:hypothetical protein [Portunus trituberculatus]
MSCISHKKNEKFMTASLHTQGPPWYSGTMRALGSEVSPST